MKKLRLRLEDLRIDSFTTTQAQDEKGTVFGEQCTAETACTCPDCPTGDASCDGTCDASCDGGCGSGDWSCGGTCDQSCGGTCGPTCGGWATFPGPNMPCNICFG
jgi:hypothetical protein